MYSFKFCQWSVTSSVHCSSSISCQLASLYTLDNSTVLGQLPSLSPSQVLLSLVTYPVYKSSKILLFLVFPCLPTLLNHDLGHLLCLYHPLNLQYLSIQILQTLVSHFVYTHKFWPICPIYLSTYLPICHVKFYFLWSLSLSVHPPKFCPWSLTPYPSFQPSKFYCHRSIIPSFHPPWVYHPPSVTFS